MTTANGEKSSESVEVRPTAWSRSVIPSFWAHWVMKKLSERIVFQARVLIRKLVKKGAMTRTRTTFFQRPAFWAMKYASG